MDHENYLNVEVLKNISELLKKDPVKNMSIAGFTEDRRVTWIKIKGRSK